MCETFVDSIRRVWRRYKKVLKKIRKGEKSPSSVSFEDVAEHYKKDVTAQQKQFNFEEIQHTQSGNYISSPYEQSEYIKHLQTEVIELKQLLNKNKIKFPSNIHQNTNKEIQVY
jgi:hypothetical protein